MIDKFLPEIWQRKTARFLTSQTISLFGSSLVQYAIIWYITLSTQSGAMMTVATVCSFLPQILISFSAGVWADRYNRRYLIMAADGMIAFSTLVLAVFFLMGHQDYWMMFIVSAIRSLGTGIQSPAVNALLPQIVPKESLTKVNGINGSIMAFIMLVSPAASGALLTLVSLEATFFVDVVTACIAIAIMMRLDTGVHAKALAEQQTGQWEDFIEGLRYVAGHRFIRSLLIFYALFMFMVVPAAFLSPLMVVRNFGSEVWRLTAVEMAFSIGAMAGGAMIAYWGGFKNRAYTLALACVGFGVLTFALGFAITFWLFIVIMFITGLFMPLFNTASTVLLQERVSEDMQGRVFSFVQIVMAGAMPAGMLIFGPVADLIAVEWLLIGTGIIMTVQGISIVYNRNLTHYEDPVTENTDR